jgi:hypothetical protein
MIDFFICTKEDPIGFRVAQHTMRCFKGFSKNEEAFYCGGEYYLLGVQSTVWED